MLNGGEYNGVRVFAESTVTLFTQTCGAHRARSAGIPATTRAAAVNTSARAAFGHTSKGFTGTSIWMHTDRDIFVVLLTNSVYEPKLRRRPATVIADGVRADLAGRRRTRGHRARPKACRTCLAEFRADKAVGWNRRTPPHKVAVETVSATKKPSILQPNQRRRVRPHRSWACTAQGAIKPPTAPAKPPS